MEKVLITGITGQDGLFLTNILLNGQKDYEIIGISRESNALEKVQNKLIHINKENQNIENVKIIQLDLLNKNHVENLLTDYSPNFVINLSGPSSVYKSLKNPLIETEITEIFDNLTSSLIKSRNFAKFYQASSSEMFGDHSEAINESSLFAPNSPYAHAKFTNHKKVQEFRKIYSWDIFSGIMFNHESEFRGDDYLIMKIINSAILIKNKKLNSFSVGSVDYIRDWSYSGDIAQAIYKIINFGKNDSYVIGSGTGSKISEILNIVFKHFNLDWEEHTNIDEKLLRKGDPTKIISDPTLIYKELSWETKLKLEDILLKCIKYKL